MTCPTDDQLRAHPESAAHTGPTTEHLAACPACRRRLEQLRGDDSDLAELRAAWNSRIDDNVKKRIDEICRDATAEIPNARRKSD